MSEKIPCCVCVVRVPVARCVQENEKSRDIIIEQRLHRLIIGPQGARIREVRERFPDIMIHIPDCSRKSDIITLRGPRQDVDRCYTYLQKLCHELVSRSAPVDLSIASYATGRDSLAQTCYTSTRCPRIRR
jgi:KH domain